MALIFVNEKYRIWENSEDKQSQLLQPEDEMSGFCVPNCSRCWFCFRSHCRLLRCSRCRIVLYCSKDCQKKDWITHHKPCNIKQSILKNRYATVRIEDQLDNQFAWDSIFSTVRILFYKNLICLNRIYLQDQVEWDTQWGMENYRQYFLLAYRVLN